MKLKKYYVPMVSFLGLLVPFLLLAQPTKNKIGPDTYRLDQIIGAAIVTRGTAGNEPENDGSTDQLDNRQTPAPSESSDGAQDGDGSEQGDDLNNSDGTLDYEVGKVNDMVANAQGRITHVVADLSQNRGWSWWAGNGLYLIPANEFTIHGAGNEVLMRIGQVQDMNIPHAESEDETQQFLPKDAVLLTHFKNFTVLGSNGEKVGNVEDVVVNVVQQEVSYAAVTVGGFLGVGGKLYAIPFFGMQFDVDEQHIILGITPEELDNLHPFNPDKWPENATPP